MRSAVRAVAVGLALGVASHAEAQRSFGEPPATLTLEAWANAAVVAGSAGSRDEGANWQGDAAVRGLGLLVLPGYGRLGARVVAEGLAGVDDDAAIAERSLVWIGRFGRLEYGDRQGLPDVMTGYAPNPFTFTTAEFGPASGLSLDPGGGLVQRFAPDASAAALGELSLLGYASTRFGDRSRKLIYVSPRRGGWLGGASYASSADTDEAGRLIQAGLARERYFGQNVLRVGGSWAHLRADAGGGLDSWFAGVSLSLDEAWLAGIGVTWNPDDSPQAIPGWRSDALGVTTSLNWNRGPWTVGGFLQTARGRESRSDRQERLRAAEAGASWRASTRTRLFLSWYRYRLDGRSDTAADDDLFIAGARLTL